jgi:hypothetical protein
MQQGLESYVSLLPHKSSWTAECGGAMEPDGGRVGWRGI